MAVTTSNHTILGKAVSVTGDGDVTLVKTGGGPNGAYELRDTLGNEAKINLAGEAAASVFAEHANPKAFLDALVVARNLL